MSSLSPEVPEGAAVYQERVIKTRRGGEWAPTVKLDLPHVLGLLNDDRYQTQTGLCLEDHVIA